MSLDAKKHEEDLQRIKNFRLLDDDFMTKCFENEIACAELLLNIILNKSDLKVQEVRTQYTIKNLQGRSVRLDILATDILQKKYNCEIQRADKGAGAHRARFNSSVIDANAISAGQSTEELPETYVIFITESDVIGANQPIYHIDRCIEETDEKFGDGSHIIYVNAAYQDDSPLGKLMHDFWCKNPSDMYYKVLADRVRYFKEDEKGVAVMCKIIEDMRLEERREAEKEIARNMLKDNMLSISKIAEYVKLTVEEVEQLAKQEGL